MGDRVILVNRGLCNNIGDQAINIAFKNFLEVNFNAEVHCADYTSMSKSIDLINDKPTSKLRNTVKKILPLNVIWFFRNVFRVYSFIKKINPRLIVIGGGQLLLSNRFSIAAFTWVYIAKLLGVKIVFSNVGCSRTFSKLNRILVNYALHKADGVNVRDPRSKSFIQSNFKFNENLHLSADIVFTCPIVSELNILKDKVLLGIPCLSVYNTYNDKVDRYKYYEIWLNFLNQNKINIEDCHLIYTTKEDYLETLKFKEFYFYKANFQLRLADCCTLDKYCEVLKTAKLVISGRMHALILGLNYNADNLVFPISDKLDEYNALYSKKEKIDDVRSKAVNNTINFLSVFLKA